MKCVNCCFEFAGGLFCPECGTSVAPSARYTAKDESEEKGIPQIKAKNPDNESRSQGRHKKAVPENFPKVYAQWKNGEMTALSAMKLLGMSKSSFYREAAKYAEKD